MGTGWTDLSVSTFRKSHTVLEHREKAESNHHTFVRQIKQGALKYCAL